MLFQVGQSPFVIYWTWYEDLPWYLLLMLICTASLLVCSASWPLPRTCLLRSNQPAMVPEAPAPVSSCVHHTEEAAYRLDPSCGLKSHTADSTSVRWNSWGPVSWMSFGILFLHIKQMSNVHYKLSWRVVINNSQTGFSVWAALPSLANKISGYCNKSLGFRCFLWEHSDGGQETLPMAHFWPICFL